MPHQNNLTLQTVDCGLCKGDVFGKGFGRVLHDSDVVTLFLEHAVNTRPSRAVYEPAVNKHNRFARFALLLIRSLHIYNDCLSIINLFLVGIGFANLQQRMGLELRQPIPCFDRHAESSPASALNRV